MPSFHVVKKHLPESRSEQRRKQTTSHQVLPSVHVLCLQKLGCTMTPLEAPSWNQVLQLSRTHLHSLSCFQPTLRFSPLPRCFQTTRFMPLFMVGKYIAGTLCLIISKSRASCMRNLLGAAAGNSERHGCTDYNDTHQDCACRGGAGL